MNKPVVGQRYMSVAEPELGLGIITKIEDKTILVAFPAGDEKRRYGIKTAPLKRITFEEGDEVSSNDGTKFIVNSLQTTETGLLAYLGSNEEQVLIECDLLDSISFHHPEQKLFNATTDPGSLFNLRNQTMDNRAWLSSLDYRGMIGGRISLISHQLYLVHEVIKRIHPRVLLADEVGLGKTIEAGMILHKMITMGRIERALIVLPNTLCYQWFIEMFRKYNLSFAVLNEQTNLEIGSNPFEENNLVITSIQLLQGSKVAYEFAYGATWDILIVDEAHKLGYEKDNSGSPYSIIRNLSQKIPSLLLLTATPEMFGLEGHFARLQLIDPDRFYDFDQFKSENSVFKNFASIGKKILNKVELEQEDKTFLADHNIPTDNPDKIIPNMLDRHGTGRVYLRNTRKVMSKVYDFFPKRILHPYPLSSENQEECFNFENDDSFESPSFSLRIEWLIKFLESKKNEKVLLICRSKKKILRIEKDLKSMTVKNKIALFHSDLSLLARDRQAAYFSDPEGANILLCTEIGSEGRNFEFSHHLILFDLPHNPDLLEQRIGRLDRIGQKEDIHLHVPYLNKSWEEILFTWYNQGLDAFETTTKGGMKIFEKFEEELQKSFRNVEEFFNNGHTGLDHFIQHTQKDYQELENELEEGRDVLIEINSFNQEKASEIVKAIVQIDYSPKLKSYMEKVFSHFGVDVEDLDDDSQFIIPSDNMFIPHFPCLPNEGFSYTFDRKKALEREDLQFMNWDHPLVTGIMSLIMGQEFGNVTVMTRSKGGKSKVFIEVFFILESIAPRKLDVNKFLPPTPIRVLLNMEEEDFSDKWSKEGLDEKLTQANREIALKVAKFPKAKMKSILHKANENASARSLSLINQANLKASEYFESEINRLEELKKFNKSITQEEIDLLKDYKSQVIEHIGLSSVNLDSFRFIY